MMSYIWELDVDIFNIRQVGGGPLSVDSTRLKSAWHLKRVWHKDHLEGHLVTPLRGTWKVSVAWVTKEGDRKWRVRFIKDDPNDKTFRSLKAAKAYALAIITLEN